MNESDRRLRVVSGAAGNGRRKYDPATDGDFWDWRERVDGPSQESIVSPESEHGPKAKGKDLPLAVRLRRHVEAHYDAFPAGDDGRVYVQPKEGGRAELLSGPFVIRACKTLGRSHGTLSAAATEAAKVLDAVAVENPPRSITLRAQHAPGVIVLDLAQPGSSRCVVVTAKGWQINEQPPPGVVFASAGLALPNPTRGGSMDDLRTMLCWGTKDDRWPLVKGWLPASLLADLPRPLLNLIGGQGSAKTTTGRIIAGVLDPKPDGVLGWRLREEVVGRRDQGTRFLPRLLGQRERPLERGVRLHRPARHW